VSGSEWDEGVEGCWFDRMRAVGNGRGRKGRDGEW